PLCSRVSSSARYLYAHAGGEPLEQHRAAKAVEARGAAAGAEAVLARRLNEAAGLNQAAEVLLVQMRAEDRLDGFLQLKQRDRLAHQLEDHRLPFDAAPQFADGIGE